ncbi:MAG: DUF4932 domain-containing protein [Candidatus Handelsmanbacteria bacterium]|nr:DUF4932 domain-containing protein [Candidatus Handelsmanbacteria bacterium]
MRHLAFLLLLFLAGPLRAAPPLQVAVDPRTELLTTVQLLSSEVTLTAYPSPYLYQLYRYFFSFRQHRAVRLLHELMSQHPWPDPYHYAVLSLTAPPELAWRLPPPEAGAGGLMGEEMMRDWVAALREFAAQSAFERFFAQQIPFYYHLVEQVGKKLRGEDLLGPLEAYYGMGLDEYHLVLSPLLHRGGFGPLLPLGEGRRAGYAIVGPDALIGKRPTYSLRHLRELVWHEFGHSFINPLTATRGEQLQAQAGRFAPLQERMAATGYPTWESCVNEHLIRAITARLWRQAEGEEAGHRATQAELTRGFTYAPALYHLLAEYETHRAKYPSIAAFLPQLLAVFEGDPQK